MSPFQELDAGMIEELQELDSTGADITTVVDLFRTTSSERVARLRAAVENGEVEVVGKTAHSLRGSTSNVGAWRAAELCGTIELGASRMELPSMETIAELDNRLALARVELETVFPTRLDSERPSER